MIVNTSYNVNETNVKVQALKELTDFNEPMVDVSSLLRQAKVCDCMPKLNYYSHLKYLLPKKFLLCYFRLKENSSIHGYLREIKSSKTS